MGSQDYTIYEEYIDSDLTWFPVTMPLTTTQAPTGFWSSLNQLSADDDFTGGDGSDPTDRYQWQGGSDGVTIQDNKVNCTVTGVNKYLYTAAHFDGNFDVQVDFEVTQKANINYWVVMLTIEQPADSVKMDLQRLWNGGDGYRRNTNPGTGFSFGSMVWRSELIGKLRIIRVGTLWTAKAWYNSQWNSIGSGMTQTTAVSPVRVVLHWRSSNNNPTLENNYDNFTVNSADDIIWDNLAADRVYFTDSDDNKLYTEIETFNHATSAATYHTAVPTVTAETDTPLTLNWDWEGRDYSTKNLTPAWVSDDFTGNNGNPADEILWANQGNGNVGRPYIFNNKLKMDLSSFDGQDFERTYALYKINPDLDIEVDISEITANLSNYWYIGLSVFEDGGLNWAYINIQQHISNGFTYTTNIMDNGSFKGVTHTSKPSSPKTGKLRIVISGQDCSFYYDHDGGGWNFIETKSWTTSDISQTLLMPRLTMQVGDPGESIVASLDNFRVNSANAIYFKSEIKDDFTGTDGDPPDVMKWTTTGNIIRTIQSNKLEWDSTEASDADGYTIYKAKFPDDFDVQVDFEILNETTPGSSLHYAGFWLYSSATNGYIMRAKNNSGNAEYIYSAFGDAWTSHITTDTTGKLRFKRVNGTITAYHWNAGSTQWEWNGNTAGHVFSTTDSNDMQVRLWMKQEANARWNGTFDNFQINGADSITGWTDNTGNLPAQTVWDSNFKIVTHLADTPTGSADDIKDSTSNENHGKSINMDSGNSGSNDFGKYLTFDGSNEYIQFGDAFYSNELTIESVSNVTSFTGGQPRMVWTKRNTAGTTSTDSSNSEWASQYIDADTMNFQAWEQPGSDIVASDGRNSSTNLTGVETYMAGVIPAAASGSCNTHINGEHGLGALRKTADIHNGPLGIQLGSRSNNNNSRWFLGNMREARLSNTARSKAWVKATNLSLMGGLFDEPTIAGSSGSEVYTIVKEHIEEELTWFPTTLSLDFTGSPAPSANFWDYFDNIDLSPNDAFTGIDGSEPDTNKWTLVPNGNGIIEINSNQLLTRHNEINTGDHYAVSNFRLSGNFDIQVDFDLEDYTADDDWVGYLRINAENGSFAYVGKGYMSASRRYRFRYYDIGGVNSQTDVTGDPTETTGKYRLRRSGSTLYSYYWSSPNWEEIDSQTYHTNDVEVRLGIYKSFNIGGSTIDHSFDNFTVSYADNIKWAYGDRLYFEDNDSNRLYTEIEQFDTIANDFTYHFAVPTISAGDDTPITLNWDWEGRDYSTKNLTRTWASDDFTGSDGDPPNPILWTEDGGTSYFKIDSSSLYASGSDMDKMLRSNFRVTGDFEIEVDWEALQAPSSDEWRIGFWVTQEGSDGNQDYFSLFRTYNGINRIISNYKDGGAWGSFSHYLTSVTSGKFKILRTDGRIYTYHDAGGGYQNIKNWDFGEAPPIQIIFEAVSLTPNYPTIENTWDNFVVNSGEVYLPDEKDDDFTGNDGDPPDVMKWNEQSATGDPLPVIQSNKLRMTGNSTSQGRIISRYILSGNFDIQIDFNLIEYPSIIGWASAIRIVDDSTNYQIQISRRYSGTTHKYESQYYDGTWSSIQTSDTSDTTGKLRLARIGDTTTLYYDDSGWQSFGTDNATIGTADVRVYILQEKWSGNPTSVTDFDNFQVNSADSITGWTDTTGNLPAQNVWDSNFKIVTHLAQEPTGSADDILDSTGNENHGTSYNMDSSNSSTNDTGAKSLTFDGIEEWVDYGDILDPGTGEYSVELFVKGNTNETLEMIIAKGNRGSEDAGWSIWQAEANLRARCGAGGAVQRAASSLAYGDLNSIWYSVALVLDHTDEKIYGYRDGDKDEWYVGGGGPTSDDITGLNISTSDDLAVATARDNGTNYIYGKFEFSEIRISNTARTPAWIAATNYSLNGQIWVPFEGPTSWDLVIQDMTVATSTDQISFIVSLIIQNLNILTSAEATKIIPLLNINDLNINTDMGRMNFWEALSTINNSIEFRTLLRTILSRTPKHTLESRTLERTLKQING